MDFNKLRTFVRVVEAGSISRAASRCFRTQQAISLQIKSLEQELSAQLFHRSGPKLRLTREGELLYQRSKEHLLGLEASWREIKADKRAERGTIAIGMWSEQSVCALPSIAVNFRRMFPGAELKIAVGIGEKVEDMLLDNRIDFGIVPRLENPALFDRRPAFVNELVPVASAKYLARAKPITDVADTLDHDLLDYSDRCSGYQHWVGLNARELLPRARTKPFAVTVDNEATLKGLVMNDAGIALLSRKLVERELSTGQVRQVLPQQEFKTLTVSCGVAYRKERPLRYLQQQFFRFVTGAEPVAV